MNSKFCCNCSAILQLDKTGMKVARTKIRGSETLLTRPSVQTGPMLRRLQWQGSWGLKGAHCQPADHTLHFYSSVSERHDSQQKQKSVSLTST